MWDCADDKESACGAGHVFMKVGMGSKLRGRAGEEQRKEQVLLFTHTKRCLHTKGQLDLICLLRVQV